MTKQVEIIGEIFCEYCGEKITYYDEVIIEGKGIYHADCYRTNIQEK